SVGVGRNCCTVKAPTTPPTTAEVAMSSITTTVASTILPVRVVCTPADPWLPEGGTGPNARVGAPGPKPAAGSGPGPPAAVPAAPGVFPGAGPPPAPGPPSGPGPPAAPPLPPGTCSSRSLTTLHPSPPEVAAPDPW